MLGKNVTVKDTNGRLISGRVAAIDSCNAWLRLDRVTGYWPVIPDPDELYPIPMAWLQD